MGTDPSLGAVVLRVQGDEAGANDLRILITEIATNAEFRKKCVNLGRLLRETPEAVREEHAKSCMSILFSWASPTPPPADLVYIATPVRLTVEPGKHSPWATYYGSGGITLYLSDVIRAVEDFWGVGGCLLKHPV